jgi:hypothetical protein
VTAACSREKPAPLPGSPPAAAQEDPVVQGQQDAEFLGKDLFNVIDQVMSYKSSHRGRLPVSLRQVGVDSLSPATIRRYAVTAGAPAVTSVYRRVDGRQLLSCYGTSDALEEALLNTGEFTVTCAVASGGSGAFKVGKRIPPKKPKKK